MPEPLRKPHLSWSTAASAPDLAWQVPLRETQLPDFEGCVSGDGHRECNRVSIVGEGHFQGQRTSQQADQETDAWRQTRRTTRNEDTPQGPSNSRGSGGEIPGFRLGILVARTRE